MENSESLILIGIVTVFVFLRYMEWKGDKKSEEASKKNLDNESLEKLV